MSETTDRVRAFLDARDELLPSHVDIIGAIQSNGQRFDLLCSDLRLLCAAFDLLDVQAERRRQAERRQENHGVMIEMRHNDRRAS
jgi:hypothetical protein